MAKSNPNAAGGFHSFVVLRGNHGLLFVESIGGGELPSSLRGTFTSLLKAEAAIRLHLEEKEAGSQHAQGSARDRDPEVSALSGDEAAPPRLRGVRVLRG